MREYKVLASLTCQKQTCWDVSQCHSSPLMCEFMSVHLHLKYHLCFAELIALLGMISLLMSRVQYCLEEGLTFAQRWENIEH